MSIFDSLACFATAMRHAAVVDRLRREEGVGVGDAVDAVGGRWEVDEKVVVVVRSDGDGDGDGEGRRWERVDERRGKRRGSMVGELEPEAGRGRKVGAVSSRQ